MKRPATATPTPHDFAVAVSALAKWAYFNARADELDEMDELERDAARSWRTAAAQARSLLLDLPGGPEMWTLRTQFTYDA